MTDKWILPTISRDHDNVVRVYFGPDLLDQFLCTEVLGAPDVMGLTLGDMPVSNLPKPDGTPCLMRRHCLGGYIDDFRLVHGAAIHPVSNNPEIQPFRFDLSDVVFKAQDLHTSPPWGPLCGWVSKLGAIRQQRLVLQLKTPGTPFIMGIRVVNGHDSGKYVGQGIRSVRIYICSTAPGAVYGKNVHPYTQCVFAGVVPHYTPADRKPCTIPLQRVGTGHYPLGRYMVLDVADCWQPREDRWMGIRCIEPILTSHSPCNVDTPNLVRNGTFSKSAEEYVEDSPDEWEAKGYVACIRSNVASYGFVSAPPGTEQVVALHGDGACISQNVEGFQSGCRYYLQFYASGRPAGPAGDVSVVLDDGCPVLVPPTRIQLASYTMGSHDMHMHGPYSFTATASKHRITMQLSGPASLQLLLACVLGDVSIHRCAMEPSVTNLIHNPCFRVEDMHHWKTSGTVQAGDVLQLEGSGTCISQTVTGLIPGRCHFLRLTAGLGGTLTTFLDDGAHTIMPETPMLDEMRTCGPYTFLPTLESHTLAVVLTGSGPCAIGHVSVTA